MKTKHKIVIEIESWSDMQRERIVDLINIAMYWLVDPRIKWHRDNKVISFIHKEIQWQTKLKSTKNSHR